MEKFLKYIYIVPILILTILFALSFVEKDKDFDYFIEDIKFSLAMDQMTTKEAAKNVEEHIDQLYYESGDYDCSDFKTQESAQYFYENAGGELIDIHKLDANNDKVACESLISIRTIYLIVGIVYLILITLYLYREKFKKLYKHLVQ